MNIKYFVLPLILLIIILTATIIVAANQTTSASEDIPTQVTQTVAEPSCQVSLIVPLSTCNKPCQIDSDCETGYCYPQRFMIQTQGVCRSKLQPNDTTCNSTTPCTPRPACLSENPPCDELAQPINGWCPPSNSTPILMQFSNWWK